MGRRDFRKSRSDSYGKRKSFVSHENESEPKKRRNKKIKAGTKGYFLRLLRTQMGDFRDNEEKEIFIDSVFEHTAGAEVDTSCASHGSKAMETYLPMACDKILLRFTCAFSKDLKRMFCNQNGSYVLQKLIVVVSSQLQKSMTLSSVEECDEESQSPTPDMVIRFKSFLQQVSKFVVNNLEELADDKSANIVVRTVFECLSGLPAGATTTSRKIKKRNKQKNEGEKEEHSSVEAPVLAEGITLLEDCANSVLQMTNIAHFLRIDITSGLLQTLLVSLHSVKSKLTLKIVCRLLDCCYDPKSEKCLEDSNEKKEYSNYVIPTAFNSAPLTHLMDVMLRVASKKLFTEIYSRCFMNRLKVLSHAPKANFCVQNLIKQSQQKEEFEAIFDELSSEFSALLGNNKHGVLLALGQSCQKLGTRQGQFIQELQTALNCREPNERQTLFPLLVAHFVDYETWKVNDNVIRNELHVSVTGSLLLQSILNFTETIKIVNAMLNMDCKHLNLLLSDPRGSYIVNAFFASKTVGENCKEKLCQKLKGSYVTLAVSKSGSRVLDTIWAWASLKCRKLILEDIAPCEYFVNSVECGNSFADKIGLSLYKRNLKDWEETQTSEVRTKKLFADRIGDA